MDGGAWKAAVHGVSKSRMRQSDFNVNVSCYRGLPLALWSVSSISYFLSLDGGSIHAVITAHRL